MKRIAVAFALALSLATTFEAEACDQVTASDPNYNLSINPQPVLSFTVRRNNRNRTCRWQITIDKGAHNDGTYNRYLQNGTPKIPVQIYDGTGTYILKHYPDISSASDVLSGSFDSDQDPLSVTVQYRIVLGTVPFSTQSNTYQNSWVARLYRADIGPSTFNEANSTSIGAYYNVQPNVDLSLTDTGQPFNMLDTTQTLDFGSLEQGQELSFDMRVGANRPFRYSMSSTFSGKLRRSGGGSGSVDNVAYQMTIGASAFSGPIVVSSFPYQSANFSPPAGTVVVFPVSVKILDNPATKNAGNYADVVTITVTAL